MPAMGRCPAASAHAAEGIDLLATEFAHGANDFGDIALAAKGRLLGLKQYDGFHERLLGRDVQGEVGIVAAMTRGYPIRGFRHQRERLPTRLREDREDLGDRIRDEACQRVWIGQRRIHGFHAQERFPANMNRWTACSQMLEDDRVHPGKLEYAVAPDTAAIA
jgi:hypothetical protein